MTDMQKSMECVRLVLQNLPILIDEPENVTARQNLCLAANYGGNAINKQLAGYVHAFAHTLGAKYHLSHGRAIALSLLPVLNMQKDKCRGALSGLSRYCGFADASDSDDAACDRLLSEIQKLIDLCAFERTEGLIPKGDYRQIARAVAWDSVNYSAPVVLTDRQIFAVLDEINQ